MATYPASGTGVNPTSATTPVGGFDVVTLDKAYRNAEIVNRGTGDLWVTIDRGVNNEQTTTPSVAGPGSYYCGPGGVQTLEDDGPGLAQKPTTVRVYGAAATPYTVTGRGA